MQRREALLPPFSRAAADGFALRADETIGASAYNPLFFRLVPAAAELPANSAVSVKSGDALPRGADAVVRSEHAELNADVVKIIDRAFEYKAFPLDPANLP